MKLMIIGASGHGKVVADIAEKNGYDEIEFYDDDKSRTHCGKWPVVGSTEDISSVHKDNVFVAIGNSKTRREIMEKFSDWNVVTLIHPNATIAEDVSVGKGTVIMAGTVVGANAKVGKGCIINTCSSLDHDCTLGEYSHLAPGSHVCGTTEMGDETWVGAGSTVINNLHICANCMIGAGAVVTENIDVSGTYVGVPARLIKK